MIDGEGEMGETNIDGQQRGPRFICIERDLLHQPPATLSLTLSLLCRDSFILSCLPPPLAPGSAACTWGLSTGAVGFRLML